jgi:hypothetical protein
LIAGRSRVAASRVVLKDAFADTVRAKRGVDSVQGIYGPTIRVITGGVRVSSNVSIEFRPENCRTEAQMSPMRRAERARKGQPHRETVRRTAKVRGSVRKWLAALDDFRNWLIREAA